jgi:hypothetical protein
MLGALPVRDGAIVILRYFEDYSVEQVAAPPVFGVGDHVAHVVAAVLFGQGAGDADERGEEPDPPIPGGAARPACPGTADAVCVTTG